MRKKRTRGTSTTTAQEKVTVTAQKEVMNALAEEKKETAPVKDPEAEIKETVKEPAKTRIGNVKLEIFETNVTLKDVEKAVKKDAADRNLAGKIDIYLNAEKRAAYYTVDGIGSEEYKVELNNI